MYIKTDHQVAGQGVHFVMWRFFQYDGHHFAYTEGEEFRLANNEILDVQTETVVFVLQPTSTVDSSPLEHFTTVGHFVFVVLFVRSQAVEVVTASVFTGRLLTHRQHVICEAVSATSKNTVFLTKKNCCGGRSRVLHRV